MSDLHIEIVERFMKLCDISDYDKAAEFVNKHNIDHEFLNLLEKRLNKYAGRAIIERQMILKNPIW